VKDSVGYSSYTGGRSQMRLRPQQEKFDLRLRIVTVPAVAEEARKNGIETYNSFTDLIDEMELWDWNVANKDFRSRLAKSLHSQQVSVT